MILRLFKPDPARPFQLAKFLSWSFLLVILGCSILMIVVIGNYAKRTIEQKNHEYAHLLAENLNHQIYRRFTLPTVLGFGEIDLQEQKQHERLDQVVRATVHGFKVLQVQILDLEGEVVYSLNGEKTRQEEPPGRGFNQAKQGEPYYRIIRERGSIWSFLDLELAEESHILHTFYPLRAEQRLSTQEEGPLIGVLQFSQDITSDQETILYFQFLVALIIISSALIMFLLLYVITLRADRINAERIREKDRLEHRLHENEKLASLGRMVATISHEIRNPLGVIQSSAEMLYKKAKKEGSREEKLAQAIYEEAQRLGRTVYDFLDYARPKQPVMQEVDLAAILRQCISSLESELQRKDVQIRLHIPEAIALQGDRDLLYSVLYNVLINAVQSMQGSGRIDVTWHEELNRLDIHDSGPGFSLDMVDKFTEPFFTTKEEGTGLGLAIVKNILDSHEAELEFLPPESEGGGLVRITFSRR